MEVHLRKTNICACAQITIDLMFVKLRTENEINKVSYALNRKKTLKKNLEATEREWNVKTENTSGTIVLEFTPSPYEVFKQTVKTYYEQGYKGTKVE